MIEVLLSYIFIGITSFITGFAFVRFFAGSKHCANIRIEGHMMAGMGVLTVYAETFSLFYKVGSAADIILILSNVVLVIFFRKEFVKYLGDIKGRINAAWIVTFIILTAAFSLFASTGYMHYDSDLYHAQSIRWIEEYGVVKGLGNLHTRLAYNSAAFPLTALFSFRYIFGRSLHTCGGFLLLLLGVLCLRAVRKDIFKSPKISDALRLMAVCYISSVFSQITSPASDYFIVITAFFIMISLVDLIEEKESSPDRYILLSFLALVAVSYKLSALMLVLVAVRPAVMLIREHNYKRFALCILLGLICIAPFLIRNVILSGYLVYPAPAVDIFDPEYKIPLDTAIYDSAEIRVYARGHIDVSRLNESISVWFPEWFKSLGRFDALMFVLSVVSIPAYLVYAVIVFVKKQKDGYDLLFAGSVALSSFMFWFMNAPLFRYGCVFAYVLPVVVSGSLIRLLNIKKIGIFAFLFVAVLLYKGVFFGRDLILMHQRYSEHLVKQQDYGDYSDVIDSFMIDKVKIYYPTQGDRTGYEYFPSSTMKRDDICLLGEDIGDGFKAR